MFTATDSEILQSANLEDHLFFCDEVGRGPLAGPVISCAVYFHYRGLENIQSFYSELESLKVTDSKKLTQKKRFKILDMLGIDVKTLSPRNVYSRSVHQFPFYFSLGSCDQKEIDTHNILRASLHSMKRSILQISKSKNITRGRCYLDGNQIVSIGEGFVVTPVVKGDLKSLFIALASIIAKEYRDQLMIELHEKYPAYGFDKHAGYPTAHHKEMIATHGVSPIHRKSFKGVKEHCLEV
ncbi:MAG: ribonuclease HII [Halobacteriovoraceae bacterium]|nr:ribonuclease HII [Halobacteriovoraceae bacterium]